MYSLASCDGTTLSYHLRGEGKPLLCLPGGPMRASSYLGDLGGLTAHRELVLMDLRGTGDSAVPEDPASYRCDRQVGDVDALWRELAPGPEGVDLLAHSAGAGLALLYAARYPERVNRLVLVTPSGAAVGCEATPDERLEAARAREGEEWFPVAYEAMRKAVAGEADESDWAAVRPFTYGRWDAAAKEHVAAGERERNREARPMFAAEGAFDPPATLEALARHSGEVLILAGEWDGGPTPGRAAKMASLIPGARLAVQPGAAHFPWLDNPAHFVENVAGFLGGR